MRLELRVLTFMENISGWLVVNVKVVFQSLFAKAFSTTDWSQVQIRGESFIIMERFEEISLGFGPRLEV